MKIYEKGIIKRNKKFLAIATIIFLLPAIAGAVFAHIQIGDGYGMLTNYINNNSTGNFSQDDFSLGDLPVNNQTGSSSVKLDTISLFTHNLIADIIIVAGGLLFSIISVITVMFNGLSIGSVFGIDLTFFSVTVLPHGIIEYIATILALVAAFIITKIEIDVIRKRSFKNVLSEHETELKDVLVLVIAVVIILAIAAIIEANLTVPFASWYFGF